MKRIISIICLVFFILTMLTGCSGKLSAEEIYSKISPSTVEIVAENDSNASLGSGFYIDSHGTVVTNYHVIEGCFNVYVTSSDGEVCSATNVLGFSKELDIAIISTSKENSIPVEIATPPVSTGETIYTLGSSEGFSGTFSEGLVSAAERQVNGISYIQISAPISHGNSGGPLVNVKGQVVGINSAGYEDGQNLNFALPIALVEQVSTDNPMTMQEFYYGSMGIAYADILENDRIITYGSSIGVRTISLTSKFMAEYILVTWENEIPTEKFMIKLMDKYGAEQGGGQLYLIDPGVFVEEIDAWCFDSNRQVGDVTIIENMYGYSICYISFINDSVHNSKK